MHAHALATVFAHAAARAEHTARHDAVYAHVFVAVRYDGRFFIRQCVVSKSVIFALKDVFCSILPVAFALKDFLFKKIQANVRLD